MEYLSISYFEVIVKECDGCRWITKRVYDGKLICCRTPSPKSRWFDRCSDYEKDNKKE